MSKSVFDNPLQASLSQYQAEFRRQEAEYRDKPISKPAFTAPPIHEEYLGDDGQVWLALANGNQILKEKYIDVWFPKNSNPVLPFGTKGDTIGHI